MAKLDDFLSKKKETVPILDLAKTVANSKEEFKKLFEKVPDFKIKPEKIHMDAIKIREKKFKFKSGKKDWAQMKESYNFQDPLPREMKNLKVDELAAVSIDWKMLTTVRPKSKLEENYFSRMIELRKLEIKTRSYEKRQYAMDSQIRKLKNKSGITEMRVVSCAECGEDFCTGKICCKFGYDSFTRVPEVLKETKQVVPVDDQKKKLKKKRRSTTRSKKRTSRAKSKSKSPVKKVDDTKSKNMKKKPSAHNK